VELLFKRGQASADQLQATIDEVLAELGQSGSDVHLRAESAGLDPQAVSPGNVVVTEPDQGFAPFLIPIAISFAGGVSAHIANTLWDELLWPEVRKRLGMNAVGKRVEQK
jgi:hypothetical protein